MWNKSVGGTAPEHQGRLVGVGESMTRNLRLRVLLIEDHEIARRGLVEMLRAVSCVNEVEAVSSAIDAVQVVSNHGADVVVMPSGMGVEAQTFVESLPSATRLLVLVRSTEPGHLASTARLPATGFLMAPTLTTASLDQALHTVASGNPYMPPELMQHLLIYARTTSQQPRTFLTARELDVLTYLARGLTNREIARDLRVSEHGVKRHVASILAKLHCTNRTMAVARAIEEGILIPS